MAEPLLLYSSNTWLAFIIAERYYGGIHYVWCTPYCTADMLPKNLSTTPPTSTPLEIYRRLSDEVAAGDRHSSKIQENKVGILRGASAKRAEGVISEDQEKEINEIVVSAELKDFRPLLYVIRFDKVQPLLKLVPVKDRAHPMSVEYLITHLPSSCFDVISLAGVSHV